MVADLYRSHACMLEWQGQVSMLLSKLSISLNPKSFLAIVNSFMKLLHQVTLPPAVSTQLAPTLPLKKMSQNKRIVQKITPNPSLMKDWAEDSAMLYLAASLHYFIKKMVHGSSNMKEMATTF